MEQPKDYVERGKVHTCDFCHKEIPLNYGHSLVKDKDQIFCNSICYMGNKMEQKEDRPPILDWIRLGGIIIIILFTIVVLSVEAGGLASDKTIELRGAAVCTSKEAVVEAVSIFQRGGEPALTAFFLSGEGCGIANGRVSIISVSRFIPTPVSNDVIWISVANAGEQGEVYVFQIKEAQSM